MRSSSSGVIAARASARQAEIGAGASRSRRPRRPGCRSAPRARSWSSTSRAAACSRRSPGRSARRRAARDAARSRRACGGGRRGRARRRRRRRRRRAPGRRAPVAPRRIRDAVAHRPRHPGPVGRRARIEALRAQLVDARVHGERAAEAVAIHRGAARRGRANPRSPCAPRGRRASAATQNAVQILGEQRSFASGRRRRRPSTAAWPRSRWRSAARGARAGRPRSARRPARPSGSDARASSSAPPWARNPCSSTDLRDRQITAAAKLCARGRRAG